MLRQRRFVLALVVLLSLLLSTLVVDATTRPTPAHAATLGSNVGSRSLIVQVSSLAPVYSPATVGAWIKRSCTGADLVLQDVVNSDGTLASAYLDVIVPFLPGGSRACFKRVFVGTVDLAWTGSGSKYVEGVQDVAFRERHVALSRSVASAFVARYPKARIDWYLTYEANLNELYYPWVQGAYRSMLTAEMQALSALRPGARFAWSPAFWYPYSAYRTNVAGMAQLKTMLRDLFTSLRATTAGIQLLDLQDFVAGSGCQPPWNRMTPADAVGWVNFLRELRQVPEVAINVEQYAIDCSSGVIGVGDPQELSGREAFYSANSVVLGPAFEIRYWIRANATSSGS